MDGMRQSNRMKMSWVALFLVTLLLGVLIGKGWDRGVLATETYEELKTFTEVLTLVQKHYVEEVKTKDQIGRASCRERGDIPDGDVPVVEDVESDEFQ